MKNDYPKSASLLQKPARKRSGQWRLLMAAMAVGLTTVTAFGQHTQTHKVSFSNIDGFSGEVSFTSSREGFATQLRGKNATLSITDYKCSDEDKATLQKAGLNLWSGFQPKTFGVVVQGKAYVQEVHYRFTSVSNDKLHLSQGLGDFTTPTFDEEVQVRAKEYQHKYNESYWERYGGFDAKEVTELYLSDLKNEINRITYAAKKEKQEAEQKEKEAKEKAEKEKQEAEEKEKQEKEKQEAAAKEKAAGSGRTASSGGSDKKEEKSGSKDDSDKEEAGSDKKSSKSVYIPKSNRQLYNELKAMTDAHPEMLNDPKIRTRLRGYKALADRDDRNIRDYNTLERTMGGGYHPGKIAAMNSIYQTNSNIAQAEMGVGAVVDEATNVVNSIVEANNRKNDARQAAERGKYNAAMAKREAIEKWEKQLKENRDAYEKETANKIKQDFTLVATFGDVPITYETEIYEKGKTHWEGQVQITPHKFVKKTVTMKETWGTGDKKYNIYIAELNGLYGILGDNGEALYPPQFEGLYALEVVGARPRFLVNIKDKWGEILADGSINEEIKYDGIWYAPDKKSKILKQGDNWQIKSLEGNRLLKQFSTVQISTLYAGGLIPVTNTNIQGFNQTNGSYSLASDGKIYVWGKSTEKGVGSIPYESAKKGEVTERLFKMNNKWFITSNFGTKDMKIEPMPSTFIIPVLRETSNGKKWGAIDQSGKTVVPFENKYVRITKEGFETDKGKYSGQEFKSTSLYQYEGNYADGTVKKAGQYNSEGKADGVVEKYYENGKIQSIIDYKNGKADGIAEFYDNQGILTRKGNYKQAKKTGKWTRFYSEKQINEIATYQNDVLHGLYEAYYENGQKKESGMYETGNKTGKWTSYYENGKTESFGIFEKGLQTGDWKFYNKDGSFRATVTYDKGEIVNVNENN